MTKRIYFVKFPIVHYQVHTQKLEYGKLGHSPVHFKEQDLNASHNTG